MKEYAECNELRDVNVDGYRLQTWDTGRSVAHGPQHAIAYRFTAPDGVVLFESENFGCSPRDCIDSDACLRGLIGFLTCRPGDVEPAYFQDYTEAQLAFCDGDAEQLQTWGMERQDSAECPPPKFIEWAKCNQCGGKLTRDRFDRSHPDLCQACELRL